MQTLSPQKRAALTRSRYSLDKAWQHAEWSWCSRHPERARDEAFHCEDCIAAGFELRVRSVRVGGRWMQAIEVPASPTDKEG
jgi:hypothetical protein